MKESNTFVVIRNFVLSAFCILSPYFYSRSYTFTPAGATGSLGPTQTQVNNAYTLTNLQGSVNVTNGIQSFTIPSTGLYRVSALGVQGGGSGGGSPNADLGGESGETVKL